MTSTPTSKRPFNLTLSEANVEHAREFTGNLSATVDGLLAEFVARERAARWGRQALRDEVCEALNRFNARHGSFADEHSTL
ncbi:MAG TPA: type II toxin-antitoxin system CcdA family antitoxin [Burkholderiaceae bacterium]|jgi:antitoxin CcdA|nr:type II toxin-antitoxin system CcdA family antitoxin [Burkholderiaceae bacterium]